MKVLARLMELFSQAMIVSKTHEFVGVLAWKFLVRQIACDILNNLLHICDRGFQRLRGRRLG